ncbi:hypothetical protein BDF22DRAFT_677007 [Syncephalis plumigaleata]|nr:hypothetical protein BDF22DRAFT_677007 [Syncephalis plumigaleata]
MSPQRTIRSKSSLPRKRPLNTETKTSTIADSAETPTESSYRTLFQMLKKARKSKRQVAAHSKESELDASKNTQIDELEQLSLNEKSDHEEEEGEEETFDDSEESSAVTGISAYEKYYSESLSGKMSELATLIDEKQWRCFTGSNKAMGQIAYYTLDRSSVDEEAKDVDNFEQATSALLSPSSTICQNSFGIKQRLRTAWSNRKTTKSKSSTSDSVTPIQVDTLQKPLLSIMRHYRDIMYTNRDASQADSIRDIYTLHLLDHIYQTRDCIIKNNTRLAKSQSDESTTGDDMDEKDELRDQGFTRPKVLIVLPTRSSVVRLVDALTRLSGCDSIQQYKRFQQEYGTMQDFNVAQDNTSKPADYLNYFAGNPDDHFRLGIRFTRKTMKLCSEFYSSDMIVASPLGLRTIIGAQGEKKRDFDFLSSIEILVIDQADNFLMQNWDHMEHLLKHVNLIPQESRDCDFSRVKNWYLDGRAKYLRQTLVFSDYLTPELNSVFTKYCNNINGKLKIRRMNETGTINDVALPIQQIFTRIDCTSIAKAADQRFEHFKTKVFPALQQSAVQQSRTMIFIPSYYDYVRIRNYFDEIDVNFVDICEYSEPTDISRSRTAFFHGDCDFMLYTERVHFYHRYRIRGAQHIFFYQLPEHAHFYPELLSVLSDAVDGLRDLTISALYSRYDQLRLERIVGTQRAIRMIKGEKSAYLFA